MSFFSRVCVSLSKTLKGCVCQNQHITHSFHIENGPSAPAPRPSSFSRAKFGPPLPLPLIRSFLCCCTGSAYRRFHAHPDAQLRLGGIQDAPRKPTELVSGGRRTDGNLFVIAGQLFVLTVEVLCAITGQSYVCACLFPE